MAKKYGDEPKNQGDVILSVKAQVSDNALLLRYGDVAKAELDDGGRIDISPVMGGAFCASIHAPDKSWRDYIITPGALGAAVVDAEERRDNQRWLFQANSDWTESSLTLYTPETDHDTDGKPFSFRHVFEAPDWDTAKLQIARLRFGADR